MLAVTRQAVDSHTASLNSTYKDYMGWGMPVVDLSTPIYSKYALGQSLIGAVPYEISRLRLKYPQSEKAYSALLRVRIVGPKIPGNIIENVL